MGQSLTLALVTVGKAVSILTVDISSSTLLLVQVTTLGDHITEAKC